VRYHDAVNRPNVFELRVRLDRYSLDPLQRICGPIDVGVESASVPVLKKLK